VTSSVRPLGADDELDAFDSGADDLDRWLRTQARLSQQRDAARVYVVEREGRVVGYSALVAATVGRDDVSSGAAGGLSTIPAVLLGKLAVDHSAHRGGVGTALLSHALRTSLDVRKLVGARLLIAHARDSSARSWYEHKGMRCLADGHTVIARLADLD
jgi:GNAT superfamily N-acetyltransferase